MNKLLTNIDNTLREIRDEVARAVVRYPKFNSPHEGYAVILEEIDEMWEEIKQNNKRHAREEAIQVAAMAVRYLMDCS